MDKKYTIVQVQYKIWNIAESSNALIIVLAVDNSVMTTYSTCLPLYTICALQDNIATMTLS